MHETGSGAFLWLNQTFTENDQKSFRISSSTVPCDTTLNHVSRATSSGPIRGPKGEVRSKERVCKGEYEDQVRKTSEGRAKDR